MFCEISPAVWKAESLNWTFVTCYSLQCNRQRLLFWKRGRKSISSTCAYLYALVISHKEKLSRYKEYNTFTNDTPALDYCSGLCPVCLCHAEKCFCPFYQIINQQKWGKKQTKQYQSHLWTLSLDTIYQNSINTNAAVKSFTITSWHYS